MSRWRGLAILSLLAGALACRTSDRLWRISPFEGAPASDRVNLWPIAYHNRNETSVLWPLFDVDDKGFALRPLVAKDGSAYSVLFPLASFDTQEGTGWVFPFYSFEGYSGLFPLANFGTLNYVGPVWWTEHSSGLFPLAYFDDLNYVGPFWWRSGERAQDSASGGLFPVAMFGPTSYVGPAWWTQDADSYGLFPLFGVDLFGTGVDHVGPVWWRPGAQGGFEGGLAPLLSYGSGGQSFTLLPLYSHELSASSRTRNYLLGLGHTSSSDTREESWLAPVYYHRSEPERSDTALLPFFWKRTRGAKSDVYTLLGNRSVDPESASFNLYPFWWSNESGDSSWKMLLPFFYFARDADERTLITPLGGLGWSASGDDAFVNFLGPVYHHSQSKRRDESRTAFLWPLFERHRRGDEQTTRVASALFSETSSPRGSETSYALGLGHAQRTGTGTSHRLWPLYSWSDDEHLPGTVYDLTLFGWHGFKDSSEARLFPLFSSESSGTRSQWNALLGLVHHESEGDTRRWWAWPLVSHSAGTAHPSLADRTALIGSSSWSGGRSFELGASLLYSSTATENAEVQRAKSRALLLFTGDEERFVGAHVPAPEARAKQNRIERDAHGFLFDAFVSESETYHVWRDGALSAEEAHTLRTYADEKGAEGPPDRAAAERVLNEHGVSIAGDDPESVRNAIHAFAAANTRTVERRHIRLPLLYSYERSEDELEWSGPLGLVHYDTDPERSRFSLLYYGYRSETRDGKTSRDIFPFVTWDSGPQETHVSLLWRLLDYERKGERRGGHVLFVPWGDA